MKPEIRIIVILVLIFSSVYGIDWSTLTASQLAALSASDFESITSDQLASIPVVACSGKK